ncbi:RNA polymerase sigma factor [Sphingobacterium faecium]|uniref:RNA polymerase sigma factor n=1 Tax=Sphingobacterium faecium TaxID=34087 RepID=UPI000D35560A|nr:sigma-70 family RNA polymerase sigma factor [Sphingobacterium faecium]PTX09406.1 RNA polymerase sigma-70 factor (ECF subfamily) [Sphingobacterium faecium]
MQVLNFEEIYHEYWKRIFRVCMGYVNDHDVAKDLCQETFVAVFQQLPKFRQEASVGTWIYRIATNICLRQMNIEKRMPKSELSDEIKDNSEKDNNLEQDKMTDFLYQCISELPELERIIISLELEEMKQAEIAEVVGISPANVRVKIHRIKEKLTLKFKNYANR